MNVIPGFSHPVAAAVRRWSLGGQCQEFRRGILGFRESCISSGSRPSCWYVCIMLSAGGIGPAAKTHGCKPATSRSPWPWAVMPCRGVRRAAEPETAVRRHERETRFPLAVTIQLVKDLKTDYGTASELQPQIAKLEEAVKEQEAAQKKKDAAAAAKTSAKPGDAKPSAAMTSGDARPAAAESGKATMAADDKKADDAKADKKADGKKPKEAKAGEKKTEEKQSDAAKADAAKADDKKAEEKKPEIKTVAPLTEEAKQLAKLREAFEKLKVQGPVRIDAFISTGGARIVHPDPHQPLDRAAGVQGPGRRHGGVGNQPHDAWRPAGRSGQDPLQHCAQGSLRGPWRDLQEGQHLPGRGLHLRTGEGGPAVRQAGLPAECELVRSLCTVAGQKRKRIGVLETDAHVMGNFTQMGMSPSWQLIEELKKQYEVVSVSPADLIAKPGEAAKRFDVLLAIQPSAMGPQEMEAFVAAVRNGQPTAIFEDPFILFQDWVRGVPGTYQPRQPPSMMGGFAPENQQKGDIRRL